jgi:FtsZ-binding cell division protein ZapB
MNTEDFNKAVKPLSDKWTEDLVKDGLINKSKTPRTDKAEPKIQFIKGGWVRADFARELERELNDLKKELDNSKFGSQCIIHELEYDKKTLIKENENIKQSCEELIKDGVGLLKERDALMKSLKSLICTAEKDEINKDHLDVALRRARNVIADIDPTIEKCDCCY